MEPAQADVLVVLEVAPKVVMATTVMDVPQPAGLDAEIPAGLNVAWAALEVVMVLVLKDVLAVVVAVRAVVVQDVIVRVVADALVAAVVVQAVVEDVKHQLAQTPVLGALPPAQRSALAVPIGVTAPAEAVVVMAVRVVREDAPENVAAVVPLIAHRVAEDAKMSAFTLVQMAAMVPVLPLVVAALAARDAEVPPALENALVVVKPTVMVAEEAAAEAFTLLVIPTVVLISIVQQNKLEGKGYENYY